MTPESLTVVIDSKAIGRIVVSERTRRKILGRFMPLPAIEPYRSTFEKAVGLAEEIERRIDAGEPNDDMLWARAVPASEEIKTLNPSFIEISDQIEEFAITGDWGVEFTLLRT